MNLIFLLSTTFVLQPSLKARYRRNHRKFVLLLCIKELDKNMSLPKTTVLEVMKVFLSSWSESSAQTVVNCLRIAGIPDSSQQ